MLIGIQNDSTPLTVDVDSQFSWNLPAGDRRTSFGVTVGSYDGATTYWTGRIGSSPVFGDPPTGSFSPQGSVVLPPNGVYALAYTMRLDSLGGSPSVLSNAGGYVHIHVQALPEPATAGLALVGAAVLWGLFGRRA